MKKVIIEFPGADTDSGAIAVKDYGKNFFARVKGDRISVYMEIPTSDVMTVLEAFGKNFRDAIVTVSDI